MLRTLTEICKILQMEENILLVVKHRHTQEGMVAVYFLQYPCREGQVNLSTKLQY